MYMKIIIVMAMTLFIAVLSMPNPLYAAPGDLDSAFGSSGKVISAYGGISAFGPAVLVQPDGKIVTAGKHYNGTDDDFIVLRYLENGTLDSSFGTGGVAIIMFSSLDDNAKAVALQSDGKILVGGEGHATTYGQHALLRLNKDGSFDTGFGANGKVTTDFGRPSHLHSIALQSDGKIIVVGESYTSESGGSFAAARYLSNGTLDTSFGKSGKFEQNFGSSNNAHAVSLQSDEKILIGGYDTNSATGKEEFLLTRFLSNGTLDTTFGNGGSGSVTIGTGKNYCHLLLLQNDGKVILAGGAMTENASDFALVRFNNDGSLDSGFGSNGVVTTEFSSSGTPSSEESAAGVLQPDGKILLGGYSNHQFALVRYLSNGALDTSFGSSGKVTAKIGTGGDDFIKSVALQANGKIVAAGYSKNAGVYSLALARFNNDNGAALSANVCTAVLSNSLKLQVPVITYGNQYYWADFQYMQNTTNFILGNAGLITDTSPYSSCAPSTLSAGYKLDIPALNYNGQAYWANLQYSGNMIFTLTEADKLSAH